MAFGALVRKKGFRISTATWGRLIFDYENLNWSGTIEVDRASFW